MFRVLDKTLIKPQMMSCGIGIGSTDSPRSCRLASSFCVSAASLLRNWTAYSCCRHQSILPLLGNNVRHVESMRPCFHLIEFLPANQSQWPTRHLLYSIVVHASWQNLSRWTDDLAFAVTHCYARIIKHTWNVINPLIESRKKLENRNTTAGIVSARPGHRSSEVEGVFTTWKYVGGGRVSLDLQVSDCFIQNCCGITL